MIGKFIYKQQRIIICKVTNSALLTKQMFRINPLSLFPEREKYYNLSLKLERQIFLQPNRISLFSNCVYLSFSF